MLLLAVVAGPAAAQPALPPPAAPVTLACAPRLAPAVATETGSVIGAPDVALRQLFGPGDALLLNVGQADGVSVGSQFFTRRVEAPSDTAVRNRGISTLHTSGWLRAVEVDEHAALAVVEQICSEIRTGDQLAPFQWPAAVTAAPPGTIGYDDPATVLFGQGGRSMSGTGQFVVIDRGADRQIVPGQRVAFFRPAPRDPQDPVTALGEGFAVLVDATSATVLLIQVREPIQPGDRAAAHR